MREFGGKHLDVATKAIESQQGQTRARETYENTIPVSLISTTAFLQSATSMVTKRCFLSWPHLKLGVRVAAAMVVWVLRRGEESDKRSPSADDRGEGTPKVKTDS